jgi:hypothetical protein
MFPVLINTLQLPQCGLLLSLDPNEMPPRKFADISIIIGKRPSSPWWNPGNFGDGRSIHDCGGDLRSGR